MLSTTCVSDWQSQRWVCRAWAPSRGNPCALNTTGHFCWWHNIPFFNCIKVAVNVCLVRSGPDRHKSCAGMVGRNAVWKHPAVVGMGTRMSGAGGLMGCGVYSREAAVQLQALAPVLCCRKGWGMWHGWERGALALSWDTGCSTHCQMKLLLEFPPSFPLSSGQLRRLMAVCLSEEGWLFAELGLRTMGRTPGGPNRFPLEPV